MAVSTQSPKELEPDHLRGLESLSRGWGSDFLCARDNPGHRVTWANARKRCPTCAID
jgi:hypothetical protein